MSEDAIPPDDELWFCPTCEPEFNPPEAAICNACFEPAGEKTVMCDHPNCLISIYHPGCVGLDDTDIPDPWFCPSCAGS